MLLLEVFDKLKECKLFNCATLNFEKVESIYCSSSSTLYDLKLVVKEAEKRGRTDILQAVDKIMLRSSWIDSCRRVIGQLRKSEQLWSGDIEIISHLTGKQNIAHCSAETQQVINAEFQGKPELRKYLLNIETSSSNYSKFDYPDRIKHLDELERSILGASICSSALDMDLAEVNKPLCQPEIVYFQGTPHFVIH